MELLLLPSSRLTTTTPYSSSQRKSSVLKHSHPPDRNSLFFSNITDVRKLNLLHLRPRASVSAQASLSPAPGTTDAINQDAPSKDENLVFVAGATGKVGSRTVRELLKLGFGVRAGVRSAQKAQTLVQSAQQLTLGDGASAVEKLEIVECDLEQDSIVPAIGNASTVICCIGASEKEVLDITGPYRIDYQATKNLIDAATVAGVNHFILLTSLGTNKIGFPAAILNLFWGVLIWKRKAEEALIASGLPYTIVRPGGMERPTDAYKETHNVSLSKEDTLFGGQVSNLQVAELMAFMTKRRDLSCYKVVEVIAETTAPLSPFEELLSKLPSKQVKSTSRKETQIVRRTDTASPQITSPEGTSFKTKVPFTMPSSYILYEDLKPPASPAPTQSTSQASAKDENGKVTVAQKISTEPPKSASDKEVIIKDVQSSGSLSPYTVYDNLKPPTSPTPTASDGKNRHSEVAQAVPEPTAAVGQVNVPEVTSATTETETASLKVQETSPLSPYHVYEDLKPPASPSPSAPIASPLSTSTTGAGSQISPQQDSSLDQAAKSDTVEDKNHIGEPKPRPLSPFIMYDDLKPPASPSPSAPIVLLLSTSTTSAGSQISPQQDTSLDQAAKSDAVEDKNHIVEPELRPLSPFSMYEDLKPPSSPIPSPP